MIHFGHQTKIHGDFFSLCRYDVYLIFGKFYMNNHIEMHMRYSVVYIKINVKGVCPCTMLYYYLITLFSLSMYVLSIKHLINDIHLDL